MNGRARANDRTTKHVNHRDPTLSDLPNALYEPSLWRYVNSRW